MYRVPVQGTGMICTEWFKLTCDEEMFLGLAVGVPGSMSSSPLFPSKGPFLLSSHPSSWMDGWMHRIISYRAKLCSWIVCII